MNSSFLFLGMLVLSGASAASATDNSGSCNTNEELNDLCGTHTFQSVKPILNYVEQLQREQLICEEERKETKQLRAKVQELEVKLAEGKLNEKLIAASEIAALSKDIHIIDLQATIAELRKTNGLITNEIAQLKTFIQEKFNEELSKINSSASKLRYCEDQLVKNNKTVAECATQLKSKDESLQSCELGLNGTQNVVSECKVQLENQNKTIARYTATISKLQEDIKTKDQTLKNIQKKLKANQDESQKQKKITDKTVSQLKSKEESLQSCKLRLNETQNLNSECKVQLENQNKNIALNTATISELRADIERKDQTLKNTQANLEVNQEELQKQMKITDKTVSQYAVQLKSKDESLQRCELGLNDTQTLVSECIDQLENQTVTIAGNTATISQLEADIKTNNQTLKTTQKDLQKQKKITEKMIVEVSKLKEQIKEKEKIPSSCTSFGNSNGIHNICPGTFSVLCNSEIAGPGWTVIQQRIDGKENFYRNWEDYKNGFGDLTGDFFLGLEKIHRLTNNTPHELYIHMEAFEVGHYEKLSFYARYDNFSIAGEDDKYRLLSLGTYSGNAGKDRIKNHEQAQFTTFDSDNDAWNDGNCASTYHAGWWYNSCNQCHLNGIYYQKEVVNCESNFWYRCHSLKTIKMLIRPRGN